MNVSLSEQFEYDNKRFGYVNTKLSYLAYLEDDGLLERRHIKETIINIHQYFADQNNS